MQAGGYQLTARRESPPPVFPSPMQTGGGTPGNASLLDRLELELLMLNMDASLRVHARHQFFTWTQGLLRSLVDHELLICALRDSEATSFYVDSFATSAVEPALFSDMFRRDTLVVPQLIKSWEDNQFRPVICHTGAASPLAHGALAREWSRIGADIVLAHGTYDVVGKPASFFTFACRSEAVGSNQLYFVELLVPFLHMAWTRIRVGWPAESDGADAAGVGVLTQRQQEILKWIRLGKSNIEIGVILEISPLTVKNHVQKILRKLNVMNRTQAVAKALAMRILNI